jgi:DNA mismatch endonuclease (patch repair protein)
LPKLEKNKERDATNRVALSSLGWNHLTIWECELKDRDALKGRLAHFLGGNDAVD